MNCKTCLYRFNCYIHLNDNQRCEKYEQAQSQFVEENDDESDNDEH